MRIIIPMAGMGKRMRPHTLTIPKPLVPIAGKTIVERLVNSIAGMTDESIEEVAFIIGDFGKEVEVYLTSLAESIGAKGSIYYQDEALGTAHAIQCAKDSLKGKVVVAFADTLFTSDFKINTEDDGVIWVKQIEDPRQFGVVETNEEGTITRFVEKPQEYVSDLAIIGIYYFKDGEYLSSELQYLMDNNIKDKGEFQLTNAMENMKEKGSKLKVGKVDKWMDCGNKNATVDTNNQILNLLEGSDELKEENIRLENSTIIEPCYIGKDVNIVDSVIGPNVSIGEGTEVSGCRISNSIVMNFSEVKNACIDNSMLGNHVVYERNAADLNIGDYTKIHE